MLPGLPYPVAPSLTVSLPEFVASATAAGSAGGFSFSINKPTGTTEGDFMIALVFKYNGTTGTPSGWTEIAKTTTGTIRYGLYLKVAGASEPSSYTFPLLDTGFYAASILTYRGGLGEVTDIGAPTQNSSSSSISAASMSTASKGVLMAAFAGFFSGNPSVSSGPSGMTQRSARNVTDARTAIYELSPSPAGSTGSKSLSWTGVSGNNLGIQLKIR